MSDEAVQKATGRDWDDWFALLDAGRAGELNHKGIVALLEAEIESMWWRQAVAVEYEKARGLRVTGETDGGSFQVGAQKSFPVSAEDSWRLLVSSAAIEIWLGEGVGPAPVRGAQYATTEGITGKFRVVKEWSHVRLSWQPRGWQKPSILQVRVTPRGAGKSVISFHHEGLPSKRTREEMKLRWQQALLALADIVGG